jgi:hypothetical protein
MVLLTKEFFKESRKSGVNLSFKVVQFYYMERSWCATSCFLLESGGIDEYLQRLNKV